MNNSKPGARQIHRLPHKLIPDVGVIFFTGCTGSGKTKAMIDVMYSKRHRFEQVIVMSGSQETCDEFGQHVPQICIFDNFDEDRLQAIYQQQELDVNKGCMKPILIVLDDLMYLHKALHKSVVLNRILFNGRHAGILMFISLQYPKGLPPDFRAQCKMVFIGADKSLAQRRKIFEAFNCVFANFEEFDACMHACTRNYEQMVFPCFNTGSDAIEKNVYWFKAQLHHNFKMCKKSPLWKLNKQLYDPAHMERRFKAQQECRPAARGKRARKA